MSELELRKVLGIGFEYRESLDHVAGIPFLIAAWDSSHGLGVSIVLLWFIDLSCLIEVNLVFSLVPFNISYSF